MFRPTRPSAVAARSVQNVLRGSGQPLPTSLKEEMQARLGADFSDVRVHTDSAARASAAAVGARAYTSGSHIVIGEGGADKHTFAHELTHVLQQHQGPVAGTDHGNGLKVSDPSDVYEEAADANATRVMRAPLSQHLLRGTDRGRAAVDRTGALSPLALSALDRPVAVMRLQRTAGNQAVARRPARGRVDRPQVQRVVYANMNTMWAAVHPAFDHTIIDADPALAALYEDAAAQLPSCDFVHTLGSAPQITARASPPATTPYLVVWDSALALGLDTNYFAGAIIHELAHAASAQQYHRSGANQDDLIWANVNLPPAVGPVDPANGLALNQLASLQQQMKTLDANWTDLQNIEAAESLDGTIGAHEHAHIHGRIQYALATAFVHNETVLGDLMYYLNANGLKGTRTYVFAQRMLREANDRRRQGWWSGPNQETRRVDSRAHLYELLKW